MLVDENETYDILQDGESGNQASCSRQAQIELGFERFWEKGYQAM